MQSLSLRDQGMEATLRRWTHLLQSAGPNVASVLLILLLAWLLAEFTWSLIPRKTTQAAVTAGPAMTARPQLDAAQVADRHLFGTASAQGNASNAPDTTLNLTLHGIVAGKRAADSRALIVANGDEEPYALGAQLPGGAVIRSIYPDRVLLERNGRLEALRLPHDDSNGGGGIQQPAAMQSRAMVPGPQNLGQLRQEIANNPQRLMDVVRAMPVMDHGKLTGYRIYPAGNPSMFNQLGLKPGDVVTAVNGIPLTDPAQSMRVLSSLKTTEQVSVSLTRNGQQQTQVLQMAPPNLSDMRQQQQQDSQQGQDQDQDPDPEPDNPP
jgi:general secretion pathway protein C